MELPEKHREYFEVNLDSCRQKFFAAGMTPEGVSNMLSLIQRAFLDGYAKGMEDKKDGGPNGTSSPIVLH